MLHSPLAFSRFVGANAGVVTPCRCNREASSHKAVCRGGGRFGVARHSNILMTLNTSSGDDDRY